MKVLLSKLKYFAILGLLVLGITSNSSAGYIVVSGDINIDGNTSLLTNILDGGTDVGVFGHSTYRNWYITGYGGMIGVNANPVSSINSTTLAGLDLLVGVVPGANLGATAVSAISDFLNIGGSLFLLGDNARNFSSQNAVINNLLSQLGSSMSIGNASIDPSFHTTTNVVAHDPLTLGISSLRYAWTSTVSGGTKLAGTAYTDQTFIAFESRSEAPEPATLALMGLGLAGIGFARKKKAAA